MKQNRAQGSVSKDRVLEVLAANGSALTRKSLAARAGVSRTAGNVLDVVLAQLIRDGRVERVGRRYRLTRGVGGSRVGATGSRAVASNATRRRILWLASSGLVVAVFAAFWPSLSGEFLNWDDPRYVTRNPNIRSLSRATLAWAFTTFDASNWHPLTWLSLALDHQIHGPGPFGYHLTNLGLHAANGVLLLLVLHRLTGALWRSLAVAVLFAVHPLRVESVAWVAERKDVLSAFFWLLTLAAYARYARAQTWASYALVMLAFLMGLMSKPMVITLPAVLLLLDYWPLRRLSWRSVLEKIPLLVLCFGSAWLTVAAQSSGGAVGIDEISLSGRVSNAIVSYVRYLWLTIAPWELSPWYYHPALEGPALSAWVVIAALAFLSGVSVLALVVARSRPYVPVGWFWYLGTLLPVIGLVQIGRQGMADRYTYIPHMGLFLLLVWGLAGLAIWKREEARTAGLGVAAAVGLALAALTLQQTRIWHDDLTFWSSTAERSPLSFVAHQALGGQLMRHGRFEEALAEYRRAAELRPEMPQVQSRLGYLLFRSGELEAASEHYKNALVLRPDSAGDHNGLGEVLRRLGQLGEAREHFRRATELRPGFAEAHYGLGRVLMAQGRPDEAATEFSAALRARPGFADARRSLDLARSQAGERAPLGD